MNLRVLLMAGDILTIYQLVSQPSLYFSDGQHSQMLTMLQARRAGDETTVHRILTDYREQRCRRRPKSDVPPATHTDKTEHKAKRRRSLTENRHEDYCYTSPQVSEGEYGMWLLSLAASQYRLAKTLRKYYSFNLKKDCERGFQSYPKTLPQYLHYFNSRGYRTYWKFT